MKQQILRQLKRQILPSLSLALGALMMLTQGGQAQVLNNCTPELASGTQVTPGVAHVGDIITVVGVKAGTSGGDCDLVNVSAWLVDPNNSSILVFTNGVIPSGSCASCPSGFSSCIGTEDCISGVNFTYVVLAGDISRPLNFTPPGGLGTASQSAIPHYIQFMPVATGIVPPGGNESGNNVIGQGQAKVLIVTPSISVTKSCTSNCTPFGRPIVFTGTVCNTGDDTLIGVTVTDNPAATITFATTTSYATNGFPAAGGGRLLPGECVNFTGSYQPANNFCGPFTDTVIASGTESANGPFEFKIGGGAVTFTNTLTVFATNSATCEVCPTAPCIAVTKNCTAAQLGQSQTISGAVTNCGNVTLTNIIVTDNVLGTITNISSLSPGASFLYSRTFTASVCGTNLDFVTAQGISPCGTIVQNNATNACVVDCTQSCPPVTNTIVSSFNGTSINTTNFIWFNANFTAKGVPSSGATIFLNNAHLTVNSKNGSFSYVVPNAEIIFSPSVTCATTIFDGTKWVTTVPVTGSDEILLSALGIKAPANVQAASVTFSGAFSANTNGISLNWKWGAAVYKTDMSQAQYNNLGVKPTHTGACLYNNSDHAGTPENVKKFVVGGARGGGGSNFTGSWSGTGSVKLCP